MNYNKKTKLIIEYLEKNIPNDMKISVSSVNAPLIISIYRNNIKAIIIFEVEFIDNEIDLLIPLLGEKRLIQTLLNNEGKKLRVSKSDVRLRAR